MDDLLDSLVADLEPVRRRTSTGDALAIGLLCALELSMFLGVGSMRPDMRFAIAEPALWWKFATFGVLALLGLGTAILSFDPSISPKRGLWWIAAAVAAALVVGGIVNAPMHHQPDLAVRLNWRSGLQCVMVMSVLALPMLVLLAVLMRRGAPTHRRGTALAVGVAAAAWGAFVFVFACPHDDPLYVSIWYGVGCAVTTVYARALLPLLTRW